MLQSRSFHNHVRVTITFVPRPRKVANIVFPVVIRLKTNSYGLRYVIDIRSRSLITVPCFIGKFYNEVTY